MASNSFYRYRSAVLLMAVAGAGAASPRLVPHSHSQPAFRADAFFLPDDSLLGFVEIPAGDFLMGSDPARDLMAFDNEQWSDNHGQRRVELPAYYVARFEVTRAQFREFVKETGFAANADALRGPDNHPVTSVSWPDALAYTRWLDAKVRERELSPAFAKVLRAGFRVTLPTEAQWEKAARGSDGRIFPWGNSVAQGKANFQSPGVAPVGSQACGECAFGLADMSGNVWEWTRTAYRAGPYTTGNGSPDLEADALWIMRGGSFSDDARNVRAAIRGGADPGVRRGNIGFRVVLSRN